MDRDTLGRYIELSVEAESIHENIEKTMKRIERCERQLHVMKVNGTVRDRVYGGEGGIQGYNIEGFPNTKYAETENKLRKCISMLRKLQADYAEAEFNVLSLTDDILTFIESIPDTEADVRTIARLRCLDGLEWQEIAKRLGGSYTDSSAKKKFYRYFSKLDEKD